MTPEQEAELRGYATRAVGRVAVDVSTVLALLDERKALIEALREAEKSLHILGADMYVGTKSSVDQSRAALVLAARKVEG